MKLKLKKNVLVHLSSDLEVIPDEKTRHIQGGGNAGQFVESPTVQGQGFLPATYKCEGFDNPTDGCVRWGTGLPCRRTELTTTPKQN